MGTTSRGTSFLLSEDFLQPFNEVFFEFTATIGVQGLWWFKYKTDTLDKIPDNGGGLFHFKWLSKWQNVDHPDDISVVFRHRLTFN